MHKPLEAVKCDECGNALRIFCGGTEHYLITDINCDGVINIVDIVTAALHFGHSDY